MNPHLLWWGFYISQMLDDKYIIGLTGGFASGKSTVAQTFARHGFVIIDADKVARLVVKQGEKTLDLIREIWGSDILNVDGSLNRQKMAEIVFASDDDRKRLDGILHPIIIKTVWDMVKSASGEKVVVVAPLLVEAGMDENCDIVITVTAPESVRIERAVVRDKMLPEHAMARIRAQIPDPEKISKSDFEINTDCRMTELEKRVEKVIQEIENRISGIRGT